jgi:hypothetical protein
MLNFHNNVRNAPMENESEKNNNQIVLFNIVTHNKGQSPFNGRLSDLISGYAFFFY